MFSNITIPKNTLTSTKCVMQSTIAAMGIMLVCATISPAGHLSHFTMNWQLLTRDRWVLNTMRGKK
jgi:hypothetical protein